MQFGGALGAAFLWLGSGIATPLHADNPSRCAVDDRGREVCLHASANRIATLSPGATELTYAAGAGDQVVAVVSYSDYPPEAKDVASVGSHTRIDLEALVGLAPDLVIGWVTGNPAEQMDTLEALGMPVFYIEPRSVEAVADTIERLARLAGTEPVGKQAANEFREGMAALTARYSERDPVATFYQVWDEPLMSVNDDHLIGQVVQLCGGENVFGDQHRLVPRLDDEAVLAANPDAIIAGGMGEENRDWLTHWEQYPNLAAVDAGNLYFVPPSLIQRPTPRLLEGAQILCEKLEHTRQKRRGS
ncbi:MULTISPECIES: cobalamin-binding protein [unclassified Halomonas]|uniref:cobalamin-binding protein n=1 Tax=unclassified Halomonas TaxID=2609666 RepID=UPI00111A66E3|nr:MULTISPECIES: cobalamin-binding protein [unclassified Halomonas]MCG7577478.1 cobalamin-binding protein [Halomonas sp. MMH1-48]MCG7604439.1 cobalamin-binding protein [Halomonas sp. MM17-34]MCG7614799.1 cobalamin-binding protein [Halomonas sp. MM17-29]MCG7620566.1 cobalamin-binding protein [Halomonas sp. DSH1-27]TNH14731.1 cobalamin-binding protein [Halomonas sp. BL6]